MGNKLIKKLITLFYLAIFLIACVAENNDSILPTSTLDIELPSTIIPTETATRYMPPTLTLTPSYTPIPCEVGNSLFDYEWCPENVLINFYVSMGDGGRDVSVPPAPDLILYADGKMFIVRYEEKDGEYFGRVLYKQFDRKGICKHFNTFEKIDYLNYDSSKYQFVGGESNVIGAGSVHLEINAWKIHNSTYFGLDYFLFYETSGYWDSLATPLPDRNGYPIIDDALRDAHYFMSLYSIDNFTVYQPEKLGVWLSPFKEEYLDSYVYSSDTPREWISDTVSLNKILENHNDTSGFFEPFAILNGNEANEVYNKLDRTLNTFLFFEKNDDGKKNYFLVASRPILPYEILENRHYYTIPDPSAPKPSFSLGCNIDDGTLPIPTP